LPTRKDANARLRAGHPASATLAAPRPPRDDRPGSTVSAHLPTIAGVAYDEELAAQIGALLFDLPDVSERRMFGGLAFLVGGHMAVAASRRGGLMVRVDPADAEELTARPGVSRMEMQGREMDGWLLVDGDAIRDDAGLEEWVHRGVACVEGLPPKA
jgi:TfoX/Sxy family transcriptional regulator of competence genes